MLKFIAVLLLVVAATPLASAEQYVMVAIGGENRAPYPPHAIPTVETYNFATNAAKNMTDAPDKDFAMGSVLINDTIIYTVAGSSFGDVGATGNLWSYDVQHDKWNTNYPALPTAFTEPSVVELDGVLYVFGGWQGNVPLKDLYNFDLKNASAVWLKNYNARAPQSGDACVNVINGSIYYLTDEGDLFRSDDKALSWKKLAPSPRGGLLSVACSVIDNEYILAAGGYSNDDVNTAEIYTIANNTWQAVGTMKYPRDGSSAVTLPNSRNVAVCGGFVNYLHEFAKSCEVYDWDSKTFAYGALNMTVTRDEFALHIAKLA